MADLDNLVLARIGDCDVYVEAIDAGGVSEVGLRDALSTEAMWRALEEVADSIQSVWQKVKPTEAEAEFGLGCAVKSGQLHSFLVGGSAEATFKIKLKWKAAQEISGE
ncbi:CU044_2847 family protein [Dactylosporangium sp. NPDC005572]|uniref:CU044_2847 family protein n=1 Tax=Dactylosporangium sp. NPDC005572 TaxID=3156889 RepID=UPI00339F37F2